MENDRVLNKNPGFEIDFEIKALKFKSGLNVLKTGVLDLENEMQWHAMLCNDMQCYAEYMQWHAMICSDLWNGQTLDEGENLGCLQMPLFAAKPV